jgi:hypothetical protein
MVWSLKFYFSQTALFNAKEDAKKFLVINNCWAKHVAIYHP